MKKLIVLLVALIVSAMETFAQNALVATLSHGSNLTTFYGENGFVDAYAAAADGDCITLSAGTFASVSSVEKAITVRGAGMKSDGTVLSTSFDINMDELRSNPLVFEGLTFSLNNINGDLAQSVQFIKSYITGYSYYTFHINGCSNTFMHCILCVLDLGYNSLDVNIYNSILTAGLTNSSGSFNVQNCQLSSNSNIVDTKNSNFRNCIFIYSGGSLNSNNIVEHCVGLDYQDSNNDFFSNVSGATNSMVSNSTDLFKDVNISDLVSNRNGYVLNESNLKLTDAAKATYKGSDGTEVGIFGGANPYTTATTNPRITNFSITTNTEGGQLKVKLNVE